MKKLDKRQWIAVGAALTVVIFLLYGGVLLGLFNLNSQNEATVMQTLPESGVRFEDIRPGTGEIATRGDTVTVHYVGTLPGGKVFDSSVDKNQPFSFTIGTGNVIRGWEEGLLGMKEGGVRRLTIAPDYGYGEQGVGPIPPNSTLIFEIELLRVEKPAQ